ncbi:phosphate ABC transporter substrate-binding protein (PhoT family) [Microcella alkaliphila]|uniref:Phosphate-binding protein n=1 Tax=Microcella alkaliphila TaxID=279828 RepID=A0A4Q7TJP6_9MICO|nr:phosphate ABC transporter substrate-binding protein PstS [Microcella alkaliphila]RZT60663.1 phosphate ABC transporter substrate-binding protein (PhoT family) [Microcella alkaliphila]
MDTPRRLISALAITAVLATSGCAVNELNRGDSSGTLAGTLDGAGSSAQASAQAVWIAEIQNANGRLTVNYEPSGSGAGREAFLAGGLDFAGSDSALTAAEAENGLGACVPGTGAINLPLYISPLVIIVNIEGVDALNLDAATAALIFRGEIRQWDDPRIQELNPNAALPSATITAVHRSDASGTTKNFTDYLAQAAPDEWQADAADAFPYGGESAQGNSGVVNAVTNGRNTIGYVDASRAGDLTIAALKVGDEFVAYTREAAARVVEASPLEEGRADDDLAIAIDRTTTEPGAYPLVLVSYLIACREYPNPADAELVRGYLSWVASPEAQELAAEFAGSAPLSEGFTDRVLDAIEGIR